MITIAACDPAPGRTPRAQGAGEAGGRSSAAVARDAPMPAVTAVARADSAPSSPARAAESQASKLVPGSAPKGLPGVRLQRLLARNLDPKVSLPESLLDGRILAWRGLPVGARVSRWARLFVQRRDNTYLFGIKPGGYVAESLLVQDYKLDCVSLFYRCTELARAGSARQTLQLALATRFAGADPAQVVSATGAVNYDDPSHLDFSLDIVRSGRWGSDVTREVGVAVLDTAGSSRFAPNSFSYIPTAQLRQDRLRDGDLLFFVLDENTERGRKLRRDVGIVIGHQGICRVEKGKAYSIHAAAKPLPGEYEGNRAVQVQLLTYLRRVEHFKGIIVTRLEDTNPPTDSP